jgi:predicted nucleotidyltransferase
MASSPSNVHRSLFAVVRRRHARRRALKDNLSVRKWQNGVGMTLQKLRQSGRETILATAARYGAMNVRVFGSVARADAGDLSDLDLLVDMDRGRSLMDLGGLLMDLEAELNIHVDVTTERMLRPEIRDRVLADAVPL